MNQHTALRQVKAPRPRPFWKPPRKPTGRIIKSQVEGKEEGANPDDRSTTGSPGLNEKTGTLVPSDQRDVSAPPTKLHLTAEEDSSRKRAKELFKPKKQLATFLVVFKICSRECALGESRQNSTYESRRNIICLALEYVLPHVFMVTRANIIFGCIWHIFFKMCSW